MAGGFEAAPGTQQTEGVLPTLTARLGALGRYLGVTIVGISGYRTPAHSVAVGGFATDPHTQGKAEDIGVNSESRASAASIPEKVLALFGLYRPYDPTDDPNSTEVNHIQLLPGQTGASTPAPTPSRTPVASVPSLAEGTPLKGTAAETWAVAILQGLGAPVNRLTVGTMEAWFNNEGGGGANNPMNTTLTNSNGAVGALGGINGANVQNYATPADGVKNTVTTLEGGYPAIVAALKAGQPLAGSTVAAELLTWSGGGYSSISPLNVSGRIPRTVSTGAGATPGTGPNGGRVRPGGSAPGASDVSPLVAQWAALSSVPRTAPSDPTTDVSFDPNEGATDVSFWGDLGTPFKWWWGQFDGQLKDEAKTLKGPEAIITDGASFMDLLTRWLLNPMQWMRGVEFLSGMVVMYIGFRQIVPSSGGYGPANSIVRTVAADTPLGRMARVTKGARAGRHEGQVEQARLDARKASRQREAARTQRAGQSRNDNA